MAYNYTVCNRDQLYLLAPSMKDWLAEDHFVWFLLDAIEQMDLSAFHAAHRPDGKGQKAHHPAIMLGALLYGYCRGERSSRQLERLCQESVPYRILAADTAPDHCAFARFRQRHEAALKAVFLEVLRLCAEAGVLKVGVVSLDGTKMKANASLSSNRTLEGLEKEIAAMLSEAASRDAEEDARYGKDRRGDELPEGLRRREERVRLLRGVQGQARGGEGGGATHAGREDRATRGRGGGDGAQETRSAAQDARTGGAGDGRIESERHRPGERDHEGAAGIRTGVQRAGGGDAGAVHRRAGADDRGERPAATAPDARRSGGEPGSGGRDEEDRRGPGRRGVLQRPKPDGGWDGQPGTSREHDEGLEAARRSTRNGGKRSSRSSAKSRTRAGWTSSAGAGRRRAKASGP